MAEYEAVRRQMVLGVCHWSKKKKLLIYIVCSLSSS